MRISQAARWSESAGTNCPGWAAALCGWRTTGRREGSGASGVANQFVAVGSRHGNRALVNGDVTIT
jgi:hypothetical protein